MEDFFYWSKEAFGFKPVIGLNHVSVHTDAPAAVSDCDDADLCEPLHGRLGRGQRVDSRRGEAASGFYWLYVNRSRIGRLGGLLGALSRPIVQRRARAGLTKSLVQTKQRLEAGR